MQLKRRPVLIFAEGRHYNLARQLPGVWLVADTNKHDLAHLGRKGRDRYELLLTDETEGVRGLNYRAPGNRLGVCMIVLSPFSNRRIRRQGWKRVGRNGDDCYRIQNKEVPDVNLTQDAEHKGRIQTELGKLEQSIQKARTRPSDAEKLESLSN